MSPRLDPRWDRRSPDEIRSLQDRKLRLFIDRQILAFSPHYRRVFESAGLGRGSIHGLKDLEKIPFTTKDDICPTAQEPDRPRQLILAPTRELIRRHWPLAPKIPLALKYMAGGEAALTRALEREYRPVSVFFTTGRTALPTAFLLTCYDLDILQEVGRRILEVTGIDPRVDKIMNLFPYAPHLAFWQVYYVGIGGPAFILNTGGGKVMGTEGILSAIDKIRPAYLVGIPGYIYHLLRAAHAKGQDLSFVKGLALGGDQVTPGYRVRVRELLQQMGAGPPRVASVLGFTESRKCWSECRGEDHAGFHTYPDLEVIEVVDPQTGRPVAEGQTGELVYTALDGRGSAVIRYRTGDLIIGGMTRSRCPHCGRTVPRLASNLDRVSNLKSFQLSKVKGTLVNLNLFKEILERDARVEEWQLVIRKRNDDPCDLDELHLNLALSESSIADGPRVAEEIERKLFEVTEVTLNAVKVLPLKEILDLLGMETQLKEKRIVDLRGSHGSARGASAPQPVKRG